MASTRRDFSSLAMRSSSSGTTPVSEKGTAGIEEPFHLARPFFDQGDTASSCLTRHDLQPGELPEDGDGNHVRHFLHEDDAVGLEKRVENELQAVRGTASQNQVFPAAEEGARYEGMQARRTGATTCSVTYLYTVSLYRFERNRLSSSRKSYGPAVAPYWKRYASCLSRSCSRTYSVLSGRVYNPNDTHEGGG